MTKKLYEALGASESDDKATITAKYRRRAKECHPDKKPGDAEAADEFKLITLAFETLTDEAKRERYDQYGAEDDPMREALEVVANVMHQIVSHDVGKGGHAKYRKLIDDICGVIDANIKQIEEALEMFRRRRVMLEDVAKRFEGGDDTNWMEKSAMAVIHEINRNIAMATRDLAKHKKAHDIAKSYKYKSARQSHVTITINNWSTATSSWG